MVAIHVFQRSGRLLSSSSRVRTSLAETTHFRRNMMGSLASMSNPPLKRHQKLGSGGGLPKRLTLRRGNLREGKIDHPIVMALVHETLPPTVLVLIVVTVILVQAQLHHLPLLNQRNQNHHTNIPPRPRKNCPIV